MTNAPTIPGPVDAAAPQISDPHFGTEQPPVVEALVRLVRDQAPTLVVLSGDITQRARRWQFRAARAFVDRLGAHHASQLLHRSRQGHAAAVSTISTRYP